MKALILDAENKTANVQDLPVPSPGPGEVLVAVKAVALNPVDALYTFNPLGSTGRVVGSDFAGLVVARGPPAPPSNSEADSHSGGSRLRRSSTALSSSINRGDRVAGFLQGACSANDRPGAFAEYVVCPADLVWRVPGTLSFEEAASVSLCALTAAQGLFFRMGLDAPFQWDDDSEEAVLRRVESESGRGQGEGADDELSFFVSGASTSVGMYAAQLVRRSAEMSGRQVKLIGTASPRNWDALKAEPYSYDHLIDYRDAAWPEKVREASGGGVHFAYDAISEASTVRDVSTTLREGGKMAVVRSRAAGAWHTEGVKTEPIYGAVWEGLGEHVEYGKFVVASSPAKRSFATSFFKWLSDGGIIKPNPTRLMPGGLENIVSDGFAVLGTSVTNRSNDRTEEHMKRISCEKLVYRIDTEGRGSSGEGHIA